MKRTHYCGSVDIPHMGQTVTLMGWAATRRDLGGVIFIDLRDREGICQVVTLLEVSKAAHDTADKVRGEYVLAVTGGADAADGLRSGGVLSGRQLLRYQPSRRSGFRWTVALIKKLQDIAWDMWDHRNGILHGDPDRHHRKGEVEQADANIVREWQRGDAGLLQEDRFLFRNPQEQVLARTLELKWQWLTSVTGARAAADAASRANDSYS